MKLAFHLLLLCLAGIPAIAAEPLAPRPPDTTLTRDAPPRDGAFDTTRVSRPDIQTGNVYRHARDGTYSFLFGGETIGPGISGARIGGAAVLSRWVSLYVATAATVRDRRGDVTRVSLNTAFAALFATAAVSSRLVSGYHGIDGLFYIVWAFGCCHGLFNPAVHLPVNDNLVVTARQATDVYIVDGVALGHSETSLGLQMLFGRYIAEVRVVKPWTRTIMNDPSIYLSAGLYIGLPL